MRSCTAARCARFSRRTARCPIGIVSRRAGTISSVDTYMADGGRYRRRRHATYTAPAGAPMTAAASAALSGARLQPAQRRGRSLVRAGARRSGAARPCGRFWRSSTPFSAAAPTTRAWRVEVHQFRIEARSGEEGRPTPEGLHRDGVDYVLVLLIHRRNIASGATTIHGPDGQHLGGFTLTDPLDAALRGRHAACLTA